ncbi:hypothetical protein MTsPCn5_33210 [Croceitalea sp. MTPC5]|nr:hypothetical protein MTsPCn5_33210 [Croceitalea sp. MTPC5]
MAGFKETSGVHTAYFSWVGRALFLAMIVLSSSIYLLQQCEIPIPKWVNNYMNDFLCMPIVLSICLVVVRKLQGRHTHRLPWWVIFCLTLYFSLYFEYYLPQVSIRYTSDIIDVLLYFAGALLFFLFTMLKPIKKE